MLQIFEELGWEGWIANVLTLFGQIYYRRNDYDKAIENLEKAHSIYKARMMGGEGAKWNIPFLFLSYKMIGRKYDVKEIYNIIKEKEHFEMEPNYIFYQLLEETSYLETAYNQVQEKADNLEPQLKAKFLSYPIPKAIVEEWEKISN